MLKQLTNVFASLQSHDVKYVVIGGIAAVLHGVPRATFDLDILIEATLNNAERLLAALLDAKFGTATLITPEGLLANEITVFNDWVRVDVQTSTPGLSFAEAWEQRETMTFHGQSFYIVTLSNLIASKQAAGRPIDMEDVRLLQANRKNPTVLEADALRQRSQRTPEGDE